MLKISIIVPVYNRPDEVQELLESLAKQTVKDFEIVIVEDGSTIRCDEVVQRFSHLLNTKYFYKTNERPAIARNFGMQHATGDYFIFFDSDCIVPPHYLELVNKELTTNYTDAFGGPDKAHVSFTPVQKAINYAMTSFLTTGGIRGGEKIDKFYPRSFNMGFSRKVFESLGGFPITGMHPGEDMVLSIEMIKRSFSTRLIQEAFVFHKRRTSLNKFFQQVYKFGSTRFIMSRVYPETFKIFYLFPTLFLIGVLLLLILSLIHWYFILFLLLFSLLIFGDAFIKNKNLHVAFLAVPASFFQLMGYGSGFFSAAWSWYMLRKDEYGVYEEGFYSQEKSH